MTRWIYRLPPNQTLLEAIAALEPGQGFVLYARDGSTCNRVTDVRPDSASVLDVHL
jgi:hypothetical protein